MELPHLRWMVRRDMPRILEIERECFPMPWTEDDFVRALRQSNCIGLVAELGDEIQGFMIYELHETRLHLLSIAVAKSERFTGIGSAMISKLKSKLSMDRRRQITLQVRERNLNGQKFFRAMGFLAINVLRGFYEDTDQDAYLFAHTLREKIEK